jgi:hypothetical protein
MGAYTTVIQRIVKIIKGPNLIRSAKAPEIRAGVMITNIP